MGTDGGYIHFDSTNPLDLDYGITRSVAAPILSNPNTTQTYAANPTVSGMFKWKVRWVGAVGKAHPYSVSANVQFNGTGHCKAWAINLTEAAQAMVNLSDTYYLTGATATSGATGTLINDEHWSSNNGIQNLVAGAANFTQVGTTGNTWEGSVLLSVSAQASLTATGRRTPPTKPNGGGGVATSNASAIADLAVVVRLTQVEGQRVQPDL